MASSGEEDESVAFLSTKLLATSRRHRAATAAAVVGTLLALALLASTRGGLLHVSMANAAKLWGGQAEPTWKVESLRTGCSNWKMITMGTPQVVENLDACGTLCRGTEGCLYFNWQEGEKNTCTAGSISKGACSLWKGECAMSGNHCMHLYKMDFSPKSFWSLPVTTTFLPTALRSGCSNWKQIILGRPVILADENACGQKCVDIDGCDSFNYQTEPKTSCNAGGSENGTCTLWKGGCHNVYNGCMDLYHLTSYTNANYVTDLANSKMLKVANEGFEKQRVKINTEMPMDMKEAMAKKRPMMSTKDVLVPSVEGMESFKITLLEVISVSTSLLAGKMDANLTMKARPLSPIVFPKATGYPVPGISIDFRAVVYGMHMEALNMDAVINAGPPASVISVRVNMIRADYTNVQATCLTDFFKICSSKVTQTIANMKGQMVYELSKMMQDELQKKFDDEVPMYPDDLPEGIEYCMKSSNKCKRSVNWAMQTGIRQHPSWYPGLSLANVTSEAMQTWLAKNQHTAGCHPYCESAEAVAYGMFLEDEIEEVEAESKAEAASWTAEFGGNTLNSTALAT